MVQQEGWQVDLHELFLGPNCGLFFGVTIFVCWRVMALAEPQKATWKGGRLSRGRCDLGACSGRALLRSELRGLKGVLVGLTSGQPTAGQQLLGVAIGKAETGLAWWQVQEVAHDSSNPCFHAPRRAQASSLASSRSSSTSIYNH